MDKFKERESNEISHLVIYANHCVLSESHTILSYSSPLISQRIRITIFYASSDPLEKRSILAKITVDFILALCLSFVVFPSHAFSFVNFSSAVDEATKMAKNNDNKTGDNNDNEDKTQPDYKTLTKTNNEDNKKRLQRKKRANKPALLDTPANANIGGLFEEESTARLPPSSAVP